MIDSSVSSNGNLRPASDKIVRELLSIALFLSCFAATFSSDHATYGIPSFYIAWSGVVLLRGVLGIPYTKVELYAQVLLVCVFFPLMFYVPKGFSSYFHGYIFAVLYVNVFACFFYLAKRKSTFYISSVLLFAFAVPSLVSIVEQHTRSSVIFGPNVLYRVALFLVGFSFTSMLMARPFGNKRLMNFSVLLFLVLSTLTVLFATGSRGALVTLFVVTLVLVFQRKLFYPLKGFRYFGVAFFSFAVVSVAFFFDQIASRFWRLFYYSASNEAISVRLDFLGSVKDFIVEEGVLGLLFGRGPVNPYFDIYPHNVFVEALISGGVLQFFMLFFFVFSLIVLFLMTKRFQLVLVVIPLLGVFVGSNVSGGIQNNFPAFSVGAVVFMVILYEFIKGCLCKEFKGRAL